MVKVQINTTQIYTDSILASQVIGCFCSVFFISGYVTVTSQREVKRLKTVVKYRGFITVMLRDVRRTLKCLIESRG